MLVAEDPRIQQLPTAVINKIAAGEVIERPASVVKELLENAVDALATRIEVDIEAGGTELIRITDNGEGIHPDDIALAVAPHATSKLRTADDLFRVQTRGFRGEALASISEVSEFSLRSRQANQPAGVELLVEGGIAKVPRQCGCPVGTRIEVRQLFLNTPVRRKFLKSVSTEFSHIVEQFTRVALACPNLHLVLRHNDRTIHDLPATGRLAERLELLYGSKLVDQLIEIDASHGAARLWGYVAHPSEHRGSRKGQYLFLNGRCIQDRGLQHALSEAYRGLLMVGRHPVAFLFLEIPPEEVDVNVHPTKSEVRFRDSQQLYRLLLSTLRNRFLTLDLAAGHHLKARDTALSAVTDPERQHQAQLELIAWAESQRQAWQPREELSNLEDAASAAETLPRATPSLPSEPPSVGAAPPIAAPREESGSAEDAGDSRPAGMTSAASASYHGETRALQVHDCYLVLETEEGLTVFDQHALHERILYEHLRCRVLAGKIEVQRLLIPIPLELSPGDAAMLLEQTDLLRELGLHLEEFGGNTVAITAYPSLAARTDPVALTMAALDVLEQSGGRLSRRDLVDSLLHMMSCKAAVKAGQRLTPEEIDSLLAQRHLVDDSHHCPHGRPTSLTFTRAELDRQFGRLG